MFDTATISHLSTINYFSTKCKAFCLYKCFVKIRVFVLGGNSKSEKLSNSSNKLMYTQVKIRGKMFSNSRLKRWALPVSALQVSAVALAITGAVSASKTSPAVAQQFVCISAGNSPVPTTIRNRANNALQAYGINNANQFTFTSDPEFFEVQANTDSDAAKEVEVDIVNDSSDNKIEEVERLVSFNSAPTAVRNRLNNIVPPAHRSILCVERSISPEPNPRVVPPANPSSTKFEIAYRCTSQVTYPSSVPNSKLDGVNRTCTPGEVNEAEFETNGTLIRIKQFS